MLEKDSLIGVHVLLAEDNDDARDFLEILLTHTAARVTVAKDGASALEALRRLRPDVLVADLDMPTRDGFWLIEQVRQLPPESGGHTPAIAVSALVMPVQVERARELGFCDHLAKPADPGEIARRILHLVTRSRNPRA
jgi:CheY-like chemotaxis protein